MEAKRGSERVGKTPVLEQHLMNLTLLIAKSIRM